MRVSVAVRFAILPSESKGENLINLVSETLLEKSKQIAGDRILTKTGKIIYSYQNVEMHNGEIKHIHTFDQINSFKKK